MLVAVDVELDDPAVELVELDALVLVGLRDHPQRVGADAEVRVHRDEDGRPAAVVLAHVEGGLQDGLIHRRVVDRARQLEPLRAAPRRGACRPNRAARPWRASRPLAELVEERAQSERALRPRSDPSRLN